MDGDGFLAMTDAGTRHNADVAVCRDLITRGSKSFALAARLFDAQTRDDAFCLYGWCRTCDDAIDGSELGFASGDRPRALELGETLRRLNELKARTRAAYSGNAANDAARESAVFRAFGEVARRRGIPEHYPLELLEGMAMDVRRERYETLGDLLVYAYRVAGTVGLMMCHIMGLRDEAALKNAADLGMAMQLTNIARDVAEDFSSGRVYLPLQWLAAAGVPADRLMEPGYRDKTAGVVRRMLDEAGRLYASGEAGLFALRFQAACAVGAASRVYAEIGRRVDERGAAAWDTRTVVAGPRKTALVASGVAAAAAQLPRRWVRPWRAAPIRSIWNPFSRPSLEVNS